jgi:hypothetical protein
MPPATVPALDGGAIGEDEPYVPDDPSCEALLGSAIPDGFCTGVHAPNPAIATVSAIADSRFANRFITSKSICQRVLSVYVSSIAPHIFGAGSYLFDEFGALSFHRACLAMA